ncbi:unnamed protein product [Camellia sinensis]
MPPEYPDLYGKRRELAKVQILERERLLFLSRLICWFAIMLVMSPIKLNFFWKKTKIMLLLNIKHS